MGDVGVANAKAESWIREVKKENSGISNQEIAKRSAKVFADIKTAAFKHWDSKAGAEKGKFDSYVRRCFEPRMRCHEKPRFPCLDDNSPPTEPCSSCGSYSVNCQEYIRVSRKLS